MTTTAFTPNNLPPNPTWEVDEISRMVEARLKGVRAMLDDARLVIRQTEDEEAALTKALRALDPNNPTVAKPEKDEAKHAKKAEWQPSEKILSATLEAIRGAGIDVGNPAYALTAIQVSEITGYSLTATRGALVVLRSRGQVRLAGIKPGPGGAKLFALMGGE